ncbi:coiled-coil domain-containing protein 22 [Burkholderia stagnalis]|nr:coiled-coil domain-containing protein 22 [Burkholderia stagnalis]
MFRAAYGLVVNNGAGLSMAVFTASPSSRSMCAAQSGVELQGTLQVLCEECRNKTVGNLAFRYHHSFTKFTGEIMQIDASLAANTTQATANQTAGASASQPAAAGTVGNAARPASADGSAAAADKAGKTDKAGQADSGEKVGGPGASGEDPAAKVLKELIEKLQRQLAELQKQIEQVSQRAQKDPAAQAEMQALNSQAGQISAALQAAVTKMAELMRSKSGAATGGLVSTQA